MVDPNPDPIPLEEFFETRLKLLQRGGVQLGMGASYFPIALNGPCCRNAFVTFRGGLRFGHARGRFDQRPTPELQEILDGDIAIAKLQSDVRQSDQYFGLYTSLGFGVPSVPLRVVDLGRGEVQLAGEIVYDHTWFGLGDFGREDDGLGTVSALITWSILH